MDVHDPITRLMAGVGEVSKNRGRPPIGTDPRRDWMPGVIATLEWTGLTRREQAVWISEVWHDYPSAPTFAVPKSLREELESRYGPARERRRDLEAVIGYASDLLSGLPPRLNRSPSVLRRDGRLEEADSEQLHEQLDVAVRLIQRRAQRTREILIQREEIVESWGLPLSDS